MNIFTDGLSTGQERFSFENYNTDGFWDSIELTVASTSYGTGATTTGISLSVAGYGFENYNLVEYWRNSNNEAATTFTIIRNIIAKYEVEYELPILNSSDDRIDEYAFDPYWIDIQREESTEYTFNMESGDFDYLPSTITVLAS